MTLCTEKEKKKDIKYTNTTSVIKRTFLIRRKSCTNVICTRRVSSASTGSAKGHFYNRTLYFFIAYVT